MSDARALCEAHAYPVELGQLLDELARMARELLSPLEGLVLSPSVSTGDFLWRRESEGVRFLSDIDGFVFTDAPADAWIEFRQAVESLSRGRGGPLFAIDLSLNRSRQLTRLPETFQMVETGLAGFELEGEGLLERFPSRFDPKSSRQALLLNLWKPLASEEPEHWAQSVARLLLDIPLIASSELGVCRPGHRARADWFLSERPGRFGRSDLLCRAVETALEARRAPPGDPRALRAVLMPALAEFLMRVDEGEPLPREPDALLVERFGRWLPPRSLRRRLAELRTVLRRPSSPFVDLRWCLQRKEAVGAAALWGLLQSLAGGSAAEATAGWLAAYAREPRVDASAADFTSLGIAQYRRGFLELYPSRAG